MTGYGSDEGAGAAHWTTLDVLPPARRHDVEPVELDGELLLLDPLNGTTHRLNGTASAIWRVCTGELTLCQMAALIADQYEIDGETAHDHVEQLIVVFAERGLLCATAGTSREPAMSDSSLPGACAR